MVNDLFSIKDKVIVITGSNQGIGKILAENMQKKGGLIYRIDKKQMIKFLIKFVMLQI